MKTTTMKIFIVLLAIAMTSAEDRRKRQTYGGNYAGAAGYRQQQPQPQQQYQQQPQQQYQQQPQQQYQQQPQQRPVRPAAAPGEEEKEDHGPHPLQQLLENSKFECGSKSDGYYADSDVGCQAFHYCVSGHKHSMMCPAGTVFHQVHLNCVPADQDICSKANKFYFVNDYLNKPLDQRGPNNTVQYHQRYYPENYAAGDPFHPPQEGQGAQHQQAPAATYGLSPAYKEQAPHHQPAAPAPAQYQRPAAPAQQYQPQQYRPQTQQAQAAPYTPQQQNAFAQNRQLYQQQQQQRPAAYTQPQQPPQVVSYGFGAQQQQQHVQQAQQAHRAYQQQQHQAAAQPQTQPQQQQYQYGAATRPRYEQY